MKIERDTTAQREALEARREVEEERARLLVAERHARQEAENNSAAKDRFLASLSHELRTPARPDADGHLRAEPRAAAQRRPGGKWFQMIGRNLEAEVQLIDELLDVSRIVHGKLEFKPAPMDVHECIHPARRGVRCADIQSKKLQLTVDLGAARHATTGDTAPAAPGVLEPAQERRQVHPGGRHGHRPHLEPLARTEIAVEITDTGIGIDPAALPKIFSAFEQGGAQITRRYGGLGLGLAISQAVVQAHDGQLAAAQRGSGSRARRLRWCFRSLSASGGVKYDARTATKADESART